jgi:death-on-curing protein
VPDVYYPSLRDIVLVARKVGARIRDAGLIESAAARPGTLLFGTEAYPDLWTKAASLLHSLVGNHPFVDGNKRVGWIVAVTFLYHNEALTSADIAGVDQDAAYDLVIAVADGSLDDVGQIAARLRGVFPDSGPSDGAQGSNL